MGWWEQQCPVRGPGLTHKAHEDNLYVCAECGASPRIVAAVEVPLDVVKRLQALGIMGPNIPPPPDEEPVAPIEDDPYYDESAPREPQMRDAANSLGPTGPAYGPGRSWNNDGSLNPRDIPRLEWLLRVERADGYK